MAAKCTVGPHSSLDGDNLVFDGEGTDVKGPGTP